jgi:hypothetical protein
MVQFGFFPGEQLTKVKPPRGYAGAAIRAGALHESVFCSLSIWSVADYVSHWQQTAERTLDRSQVSFFCSDLTKQGACLLVSFPGIGEYWFEEWIVPRRNLVLGGFFISLLGNEPTPSVGGSSWSVARPEIEAFVRMGS